MLLVNENSRAKQKSTNNDGERKRITKFYGCCGKFTRLNTRRNKKNNYASCLTDCELYEKLSKGNAQLYREKKDNHHQINIHGRINKSVCCV